ncbi:MAG: hypothetical protein H6912_00770 [Kordiimonadaceae bacterium]|nr:hypothetical protein [Kordiimonadaceae bacterium]
MLKKLIILSLSAIFVWGQTSIAFAQNLHYSAFDQMKESYFKGKINSRGLTGQLGLTIPFGDKNTTQKKAFYGFKMTYGQEMRNSNPFQYGYTRDLNLFSTGFNNNGVKSLSLASYEILDESQRKNIFGNGNGNGNVLLWTLGLALVAGGVCWAAGCFDGNDSSSTSDLLSN